ncbi:DUF4097 family beta strand repeat-containing protein [Cyclobacterium xiamenense]|uniref:DUF4097 family beta strand repeat-containing protein n=1 Tax=Cyclobacterium xiamenense TaxID=1297121 RepID=UPI0035D046A1
MKTLPTKQEKKIWYFRFPFKKIGAARSSLALLLLILTSCMDAQLETVADIEEHFENITSIEVEAGSLPAQYLGDPSLSRVTLQALLRSTANAQKTISYRVEGETLIVRLENNGLGFGRSEGHIHLTGPRHMSLQMHAGSGSVQAENASGDRIDLEVNSGRVFAKNLEAPVSYLTASSGAVVGESLKGTTVATVSSGKLSLTQLDGDLQAETSSGAMDLKRINGLVHVNLSSGKIDMDGVQALGSVHLSSGKVSGSNVGLSEHTSFKASSGTITVQTYSDLGAFNYDIHTGSGRARIGESQSSGSLVIRNGSPYTIRGEVNSGTLTLVN